MAPDRTNELMQADIEEKRDALAALWRRHGVARLEVFGSAASKTVVAAPSPLVGEGYDRLSTSSVG